MVLLTATSCKKSGVDDDLGDGGLNDFTIVIPSAKSELGIGDNDGVPAHTPLELPDGIRFVSRPNKPFDPDVSKLYGNVNTFYADVNVLVARDTIENTTPYQFILPRGLLFIRTINSKIQNGLLMDRVVINIPPKASNGSTGGKDTITVYVGLACINAGFGLPWEENIQGSADIRHYPIGKDMYLPLGVTKHSGLLQLAELLSQYPKLRLKQHYDPNLLFDEEYEQPEWMQIYFRIQEMVWKLTDGPGIMRGELEEFKKELEPYK